jgi:hypothetical protein
MIELVDNGIDRTGVKHWSNFRKNNHL